MKAIPNAVIAGLVWAVMAAAAAPVAAATDTLPPPNGEALFNIGLTHLSEGRYEQALDHFQRAIKQEPKNAYFYKGLGQAHLAMGHAKEAIEAFRRSLQFNPYYADVHNDLGTALILAGKRGEGKREFQTALNDAMNPSPELSARNLGQALFEEKNYSEALTWFQTSLQRNPRYPDAHLGVADTLFAQGKTDLAVKQLENAREATEENPAVMLALGQAYFQVGRFTEARGILDQLAEKDPTGPTGRRARELLKSFPH